MMVTIIDLSDGHGVHVETTKDNYSNNSDNIARAVNTRMITVAIIMLRANMTSYSDHDKNEIIQLLMLIQRYWKTPEPFLM
jgi:hypothetical protein